MLEILRLISDVSGIFFKKSTYRHELKANSDCTSVHVAPRVRFVPERIVRRGFVLSSSVVGDDDVAHTCAVTVPVARRPPPPRRTLAGTSSVSAARAGDYTTKNPSRCRPYLFFPLSSSAPPPPTHPAHTAVIV